MCLPLHVSGCLSGGRSPDPTNPEALANGGLAPSVAPSLRPLPASGCSGDRALYAVPGALAVLMHEVAGEGWRM
jgi:hypothetical protein